MPLRQGATVAGMSNLRSPAELAEKLVRFLIAGKRGGVSTTAATTARDVRLDFFRGVALFLIFADHIPGNVLSHFTVQSLGFSDAAEIFIFVSGYFDGAGLWSRDGQAGRVYRLRQSISPGLATLRCAHLYLLIQRPTIWTPTSTFALSRGL